MALSLCEPEETPSYAYAPVIPPHNDTHLGIRVSSPGAGTLSAQSQTSLSDSVLFVHTFR